MSIGPSVIFDKSALEALSADESMWLENFFISNITPLFFVETLADQTPEEGPPEKSIWLYLLCLRYRYRFEDSTILGEVGGGTWLMLFQLLV